MSGNLFMRGAAHRDKWIPGNKIFEAERFVLSCLLGQRSGGDFIKEQDILERSGIDHLIFKKLQEVLDYESISRIYGEKGSDGGLRPGWLA